MRKVKGEVRRATMGTGVDVRVLTVTGEVEVGDNGTLSA